MGQGASFVFRDHKFESRNVFIRSEHNTDHILQQYLHNDREITERYGSMINDFDLCCAWISLKYVFRCIWYTKTFIDFKCRSEILSTVARRYAHYSIFTCHHIRGTPWNTRKIITVSRDEHTRCQSINGLAQCTLRVQMRDQFVALLALILFANMYMVFVCVHLNRLGQMRSGGMCGGDKCRSNSICSLREHVCDTRIVVDWNSVFIWECCHHGTVR